MGINFAHTSLHSIDGRLEIAATAFSFGLALHIFVFTHGEWDTSIPRVIGVSTSVLLACFTYLKYIVQHPAPAGLVMSFGSIVLLSIATSITIYRLFFHRLRGFPGPFLARISNFWITSRSAKKWHLYEEVEVLHKKYGDFVRIGIYFDINCNILRSIDHKLTIQVPPKFLSIIPKASRQFILHLHRVSKAPGTMLCTHGYPFSTFGKSQNTQDAERFGIVVLV